MDPFTAMLTEALKYTASDHSPCIGICDHTATQACSGCQRRHNDVENWRTLDAKTRKTIWEKIPKKLAHKKTQFLRLPLDQEDILHLAKARLEAGGTWMLGGLSATKATGNYTAINSDGTTTLRLHEDIKMRALLWAPPTKRPQRSQRLDDAPSTLPLLLVVARARLDRGEGAHQKPLPKNYREIPQPNDSFRISASANKYRIESALATAETITDSVGNTATPLPTSLFLNGLTLPASYALGLTLLP